MQQPKSPSTSYLITGATGFIGKRLMARLIERGGLLNVLCRPGSLERNRTLFEAWSRALEVRGGALRILPGDLEKPDLGLGNAGEARFEHVFHLAANYQFEASMDASSAANVDGLRHLLGWLTQAGFTGLFHHVSSIAVAGDFVGTFTEQMLDAGQTHAVPYLKTKFEAEALLRWTSDLRWRVYRPGAVVGDSATGEADKLDGPYYVFPTLQRLRHALPAWVPLPAPASGSLNMVPVDFVASALDHIAHQPGLDGQTFHLVDPKPPRLAKALDLLLEAAHGPRIRWMWKSPKTSPLGGLLSSLAKTPTARFLLERRCQAMNIPIAALDAFNPHVRFDDSNTRAALAGSGIACPPLRDYVAKLWAYYELHLDPTLHKQRRLAALLPGKRVLITGASSGIGEALALECGRLGAHVILAARREDKLAELASAIRTEGGRATTFRADLSQAEDCEALVKRCLEEVGAPDILVLNAGKSIRRSVVKSLDRFHDLERTMRLNYFGAARLVMGFLPAMRERGSGHIVHNSSWGVLLPGPRYGGYAASKAALDTFLSSFAAEHLAEGIHVSQVFMPWVRTPMVEATKAVEETRMMTPEQAAGLLLDAMLDRRRFLIPGAAYWLAMLRFLMPELATSLNSLLYRLYPDQEGEHPEFDLERQLLKRWIKGSPI